MQVKEPPSAILGLGTGDGVSGVGGQVHPESTVGDAVNERTGIFVIETTGIGVEGAGVG